MITQQKGAEIQNFIESVWCREFDSLVTKQQLMENPMIPASWGMHCYSTIRNKAVVFAVTGALFKGFVVITLNFMDTYDVFFLTHEGDFQKDLEKRGIYNDMLADVIDKVVETP